MRTAAALLGLLTAVATLPCVAQDISGAGALAEGQALVEKAERALEAGYVPGDAADRAVEVLKLAVAAPAPSPQAFYYLGRAYALAGHPDLACANLSRFVDMAGADDAALAVRARDYVLATRYVVGCRELSAGRGSGALPHLRMAAQLAPENPAIARKLRAAESGLADPSREQWLEFPSETPDGAPLRVRRPEVVKVYGPRARHRLAAV